MSCDPGLDLLRAALQQWQDMCVEDTYKEADIMAALSKGWHYSASTKK